MNAGHGKFIINLLIPRCLMLRTFRDAGFVVESGTTFTCIYFWIYFKTEEADTFFLTQSSILKRYSIR
ncbi:hypothetical protein IW22_04845 [Chryseobacterium sp. JM1]|nr:hypothetical protein IW22_04845 [Chryseobacterium sp. JM1]